MVKTSNLIQNAIAAFSILASAQAFAADPCCAPEICCSSYTDGKVFIRGDLLYLSSEQDGLSGCGSTQVEEDFDSQHFAVRRINSRCKQNNHNWDLGYRVAGGLRLGICNPSAWEILGNWTHFSQGSGVKCDVFKDDSKWRLKFDYADLVFAYNLSFNCTNLKFFSGLRGALIEQKLQAISINHLNDVTVAIPVSECEVTSIRNKQKFEGLGPLLGVEAGWDFGCGLNAYFNADVGCLFGRHKITEHSTRFFEAETIICNHKCKENACQYFVDSALGVRWNILLCAGSELFFQLGIEQHTYFNVNYLGNRGNLNVYGGSFSAGLRF